MQSKKFVHALACTLLLVSSATFGLQRAAADNCTQIKFSIKHGIPGNTLYQKLQNAMTDGKQTGKGLALNQWGTIVDKHGIVCAVVHTGSELGDQWLGSRVISAQKASTALDYSITHGLALSTANLWAATQPGSSLFGLQFSNPVDTSVAYGNNSNCAKQACDTSANPDYGSENDPMVGHYIGGNNVFGGGLALYDKFGNLIGALGTSGNTSCADHYISWVVRSTLGLDHVPAGVASGGTHGTDNIIFDVTGTGGNAVSASGFGHPLCGIDSDEVNYPSELTTNYPVEPVQ